MSKKAKGMPRVFLDTSVQVTRILGDAKKRHQIERIVEYEIEACTTAYVYMEYQRTVMADFAHVYRILQQTGNWGDAIANVASGARLFRPRALARVNRILGETLNRSHLDVEKGLLYLRIYLDYRLHDLFWHQVEPLNDTIRCDLLTPAVARQANDVYLVPDSCRKDTAACLLPDFLTEQKTKLNTIADYLSAHTNVIKDQPRVEQLLQVVQNDPRSALGQASCWPLGDIIILLHMPADCAIWSLDPDFAPLGQALGFSMFSHAS